MSSLPVAVVWAKESDANFLRDRTLRQLKRMGLEVAEAPRTDVESLRGVFQRYSRPLVLLRAGTWFQDETVARPLPRSSTGMGVCAISLGASDQPWLDLLANDFKNTPPHRGNLELPAALYLDREACQELLLADEAAQGAQTLAVQMLRCSNRLRIVQWPGVEVRFSVRLRVLQIITSLQRGGAERMAIDLTSGLGKQGVTVRIATTGQPGRTPFPLPAEHLDLERIKANGETCQAALLRIALDFDLLHFHLLAGEEMNRFCQLGIPAVCTIHNSKPGWPRNLLSSADLKPNLVAACSMQVEEELRAAEISAPVRTIWNGIELGRFDPAICRPTAVAAWRKKWGFNRGDVILLAMANPRPQKRLHLLPGVLAAMRENLGHSSRRVRLVFAGESSPGNPEAVESERLVRTEVERLGLSDDVRWAGSVEDVPSFVAAVDVLVSASAHEGLSLTHLEALATNVPVVCTATAGTFETSFQNPAMTVLPIDVTADAFARAILDALKHPASGRNGVARNFSAERMAERYLWFYKGLVSRSTERARSGVWLITNNFSMGGAQTSARRLLTVMASRGVKVRAAVIQEEPDQPTPGRSALVQSGIPVLAFGPHGKLSAEEISLQVLHAMEQDAPAAVIFWNLIAGYKVLLADGLLDTPVFDVSPGEMYFSALRDYFANGRPGLPYLQPADYGRRLAGVIVKYHGEIEVARTLGAAVHVIPNGTPIGRPIRRPATDVLRIGTAARVHPQKRLEDLIAALHLARPQLPTFEVQIAGRVEPGCEEYFQYLRELCQDLPVVWVGELPDTGEFLQGLDIFAMISEPAGCPNALLEALSAGLAVVATDVGGAKEQVIDNVTGLLVPARDPSAFAGALIRLAQDHKMRRKLGANAVDHIQKHFSLERMADRYEEVCLGVPARTHEAYHLAWRNH